MSTETTAKKKASTMAKKPNTKETAEAKAKANKPPPQPFEVKLPDTAVLRLRLTGQTKLVVNNKQAMQGQFVKRAEGKNISNKGKIRDKLAEYEATKYVADDGTDRPGMPSNGIKEAIISALSFTDVNLAKAVLRRIMHVNKGVKYSGIDASDPNMREDIVLVGGKGKGSGTPDIRWRAEYDEWSCDIEVEFLPTFITAESIVSLAILAGRYIGLCEWRPEKGGSWGMFDVDVLND